MTAYEEGYTDAYEGRIPFEMDTYSKDYLDYISGYNFAVNEMGNVLHELRQEKWWKDSNDIEEVFDYENDLIYNNDNVIFI